ncbi:class III peroxidase [Tripterygium wilfordii]|uniref:Class III peroxidase n=1 Tax=Tripterygium wilfordii TaxID=458696 RepID=A0A7J7CYG3_TRIWF|nr:class III peroxidase [Tripterygium wilfordii]
MLMFLLIEDDENRNVQSRGSLESDFYRDSRFVSTCREDYPQISPSTVEDWAKTCSSLLRLVVFHDCFIEGFDAYVLLDPAVGVDTEKESPPYETLKGFGIIHLIRLVAHSIHFTLGGETVISYKDISTYELPSPPC